MPEQQSQNAVTSNDCETQKRTEELNGVCAANAKCPGKKLRDSAATDEALAAAETSKAHAVYPNA